jgi:hypothetical protein
MKTDFCRCFEVISSIVWLQVESLTSGSELPALFELTVTLLSSGLLKTWSTATAPHHNFRYTEQLLSPD